jgi:hypothetical protein
MKCEYTEEQIRKTRRRIEDFLRKAPADVILAVARFLHIKTD